MKLLLDENLSRRIVLSLQEHYPGTTQVAQIGLEKAGDKQIWDYAKSNGFVLVSKDEDFLVLQAIHGYPPKLIHLELGNCTNQDVLKVLARSQSEIELALSAPDVGVVRVGG